VLGAAKNDDEPALIAIRLRGFQQGRLQDYQVMIVAQPRFQSLQLHGPRPCRVVDPCHQTHLIPVIFDPTPPRVKQPVIGRQVRAAHGFVSSLESVHQSNVDRFLGAGHADGCWQCFYRTPKIVLDPIRAQLLLLGPRVDRQTVGHRFDDRGGHEVGVPLAQGRYRVKHCGRVAWNRQTMGRCAKNDVVSSILPSERSLEETENGTELLHAFPCLVDCLGAVIRMPHGVDGPPQFVGADSREFLAE
jgi:hypothetical protein